MNDKFTYVNGDDWVGIYKNGELVEEGHSIPMSDLFEILGLDVDTIYADQEWLEDMGNLPKNLDEVKEEE